MSTNYNVEYKDKTYEDLKVEYVDLNNKLLNLHKNEKKCIIKQIKNIYNEIIRRTSSYFMAIIKSFHLNINDYEDSIQIACLFESK